MARRAVARRVGRGRGLAAYASARGSSSNRAPLLLEPRVIGKGEVRREVPLNALVRQVLEEWLAERAVLAREDERALWISRSGGRLSARSADRDVRAVAAAAGLELSAHTLRHTCPTGLVRRGNDLVMVAELAGHTKLETTRRYTLPSAADRQRAVEDLQIDY